MAIIAIYMTQYQKSEGRKNDRKPKRRKKMKNQCKNCSKNRWCGLKLEVGGCPSFRQRKRLTRLGKIVVAAIAALWLMAIMSITVFANEFHLEWVSQNGLSYWIEYGQVQGVQGDPKNIWDKTHGIERGREIYDPASDGWYWLDACRNGAKAEAKEVWMPYIFQDDLKMGKNPDGKWVMYDNNGKMAKGWMYRADKDAWYFYDLETGAMAKGWKIIGDYGYRFDKKTGVMVDDFGNKIGYTEGWRMVLHSMRADEIYYTLDVLPGGAWLIQANVTWPSQLPKGVDYAIR